MWVGTSRAEAVSTAGDVFRTRSRQLRLSLSTEQLRQVLSLPSFPPALTNLQSRPSHLPPRLQTILTKQLYHENDDSHDKRTIIFNGIRNTILEFSLCTPSTHALTDSPPYTSAESAKNKVNKCDNSSPAVSFTCPVTSFDECVSALLPTASDTTLSHAFRIRWSSSRTGIRSQTYTAWTVRKQQVYLARFMPPQQYSYLRSSSLC